MSSPPVIGISALASRGPDAPHLPTFALNQRYALAVAAAGGAPLLIPPGLDVRSLRVVYDRLDGVLLSGGGDVDPARYGESPHPSVYDVDPGRDETELSVARWAVADDKPLLAICRGVQVLNVALGGSLVQDIPSQWPDPLLHIFDLVSVERDFQAHAVRVDPGTRLHAILGSDQATVNSWHHQSLRRVASPLQVTACAPDGIIESVEMPGRTLVLGVQWHPEWLYDSQPEMKRLFEALVQAAAN